MNVAGFEDSRDSWTELNRANQHDDDGDRAQARADARDRRQTENPCEAENETNAANRAYWTAAAETTEGRAIARQIQKGKAKAMPIRDDNNQTLRTVELQPHPMPTVQPPAPDHTIRILDTRPSKRLQSPCPTCHSEIGQPCTNYKGQRCAPHGQRKDPGQPARSKAGNRAATDASVHRAAIVAGARADTNTELATATPAPAPEPAELVRVIRDLVARYGCPSVIDATWEASTYIYAQRSQPSA